MIKTGITGGTSDEAGELLRILVNHPDVELCSIAAPAHRGEQVQNVHHGLIGETDLRFSDRIDPSKVDVIFICPLSENPSPEEEAFQNDILSGNYSNPELRIIDLTHSPLCRENEDYVFGLSEIFRKPLVRGAKKATLPYPEESAALISLFPLALRLLINEDLSIHLTSLPGALNKNRLQITADNIADNLRKVQKSFNGDVKFTLNENPDCKGLRLQIELSTTLDYPHILESYQSIYDDHNFTFMTSAPVDSKEVAGTNRCIISLRKSNPDTLVIDTIIDNDMRGGSGEAVHLLNLLFGLHERTGLNLKANIR